MDDVRLSKTLSHALRHAPEAYDLVLDDGGWTPLADVVRGVAAALRAPVTADDVARVVAESPKRRFELDGASIRAAYGQAPVNVFEPYKAPYNEGVGLASADRLTEARAKFEEALPLAWGVDACAVRVNLSLTIEALGDRAADDNKPADAQELYAAALKVTAEMPAEWAEPVSRSRAARPRARRRTRTRTRTSQPGKRRDR